MKDAMLRRRAASQDGVVARWQLLADGMTVSAVRHDTRGLREVHGGVYLTGDAAGTQRQGWWAAVLTAPRRFLSHASAGSAYGFRPCAAAFEVVTTAGTGGPRRFAGLLVCRSTTLDGNTTTLAGIPATTAERALADLAPGLDDRELDRAVREALRLRVTTCARIQVLLASAGAPNRPARLGALAREYARLPIARTRSDAEAHALALLDAAGIPTPRVNVDVNGAEADLSWADVTHIVELDGPDFHQFPDVDLAKQVRWEQAGWTVSRLPTDDVYERPARLLAAAEPSFGRRRCPVGRRSRRAGAR